MEKEKTKKIKLELRNVFWNREMYEMTRTEVKEENSVLVSVFAFIAAGAFSVMMVAAVAFENLRPMLWMYCGYTAACVLIALLGVLNKTRNEALTYTLVFSFQCLILSFGIVMGTLIRPEKSTVSYLVLLLATPLLFVVRALYANLVTVISIAAYIVLASFTQPQEVLLDNIVNIIVYGILSLIITTYLMYVRFQRYEYQCEKTNSQVQIDNYEKIITEMIRFSASEDDAGDILNHLMQYIGVNSCSDRAYVFEQKENGNYANTYEWCRPGVEPEIDNMKDLPADLMNNTWFRLFRKYNNIEIVDVEEYRPNSEEIYQLLKRQNIHTLVAGPIRVEGQIIGFFGVDNPPKEAIQNLSELFKMMEFILSMMIRLRNKTNAIEESALHDQLTGCKNRKALTWAYDGEYDESKPFTVIECDLNGLKEVNDKQGHEAGDRFICRTADLLGEIFGKDNVYRMGGDEFAVVLAEMSREEVDALMEISKIQIGTTATMGVAHAPVMDMSFDKLLHDADMEMYRLKDLFYQDKRRYRS